MDDAKADYLLSSEGGERFAKPSWFDMPSRFILSRLGLLVPSSGNSSRLIKISEMKTVYAIRYFRYTITLFFMYLFLGMGYFSGHAGFTVLDSVYFIVISFFTVGYGDFKPRSENQRMFMTFYIIIGFSILCIVGVTAGDFISQATSARTHQRSRQITELITRAKFDIADEKQTNAASTDTTNSGIDKNIKRSSSRRLSMMHLNNKGDIFPSPYSITDPRVIELMRKVNMDFFDEELEAIKWKSYYNFIMIVGILCVGSLCIGLIEDWSANDALYWACVTITTTGFGDVTPETRGGKVFTIFYCLIGVGLMAKAVTDLASYPFIMREKKTELQVLMQFGTDLSPEQLSNIQNNEFMNLVPKLKKSQDRIEKSEFVLILLQLMDKVKDTDIVYISEIFDALDKNNEGFLSKQMMASELESARERERISMTQRTRSSEKFSSSREVQTTNSRVSASGTPPASSYQPPSVKPTRGSLFKSVNETPNIDNADTDVTEKDVENAF